MRDAAAILGEIQALCQELEDHLKIKEESKAKDERTRSARSTPEERSLPGASVVIVTSKLSRERAVVIDKRSPLGTSDPESFWNLKLLGSGEIIWRKRNGFRITEN